MSKRRGKRIVVGYVVSHTGKRGGPWEADMDALRAALTEARAVLSLCKTARNRSVPEYIGVRDIGRNIGYGAMMSAASSAWAEMFDGTPQEGSQHTCGPSEFTVRRAIARIDEVLSPGAHVGAAKKGGG